jgi:putative FmdB family regulatory protein
MPIYEYVCEACQTRYEQLAAHLDARGVCPACGSDQRTLCFSVFSAPKSNAAASASQAAGPACAPSG